MYFYPISLHGVSRAEENLKKGEFANSLVDMISINASSWDPDDLVV